MNKPFSKINIKIEHNFTLPTMKCKDCSFEFVCLAVFRGLNDDNEPVENYLEMGSSWFCPKCGVEWKEN